MICLLVLFVSIAGAQGSGSLVRGNTFTVTVIGHSRTLYDIWPKGTHDMTGEPGDQPPVIVPGQVDVTQDPPGGPYTLGSHPIGGGGTIRDDVPPDSSTTSATAYYAEVRTDASGYGVVLFRTSSATATQQFHITAENPIDLSEDVGLVLGLPPTPAPVIPLPLPTTMKTPFMPVTTRVPATPVPTATPTPVPLITPVPMETPTETSPTPAVPLPAAIGVIAAGIGLLLAARVRKT
ncbi:MAG TPA: hypothetical protein VKO45_05940 [Methanomicrobiales archaeon]|nr:hypothetical protein [Methanomicrobiales archaeon]